VQSGQGSSQSLRQSARSHTANYGAAASASGGSNEVEQFMANCLLAENEAEVQLTELAQQQAQSSSVKQFAQKMAQDHRQMIQQLQQIAGTQGSSSSSLGGRSGSSASTSSTDTGGSSGLGTSGTSGSSSRGSSTSGTSDTNSAGTTTSGPSGLGAGTSGTSGTAGTSGTSGTGTSGAGTSGTSGGRNSTVSERDLPSTPGVSGTAGSSTSGSSGLPGSSGASGSSTTTGRSSLSSSQTTDLAGGVASASSGGAIQQLMQIDRQVVDRKSQMTKEELQQKQGAEFDKAFVGTAIPAHIHMIAQLEVIERQGQGQLAQIAQQARPIAQQHLEHAKQLMRQLDNQSGGSSASQAERSSSRRER